MPTLCNTCIHFRDEEDGRCGHPNVSVSLVNGALILRSAPWMRQSDGPCGPEARLWQSLDSERVTSPSPLDMSLPNSPPVRTA